MKNNYLVLFLLFNCANTSVNDDHHFCDNLKGKRSLSVPVKNQHANFDKNHEKEFSSSLNISTIKDRNNNINYQNKFIKLTNTIVKRRNEQQIQEELMNYYRNVILKSSEDIFGTNKFLQLFEQEKKIKTSDDQRLRLLDFDEEYIFIFSNLENIDKLFLNDKFLNLLNDEENLFCFIVYFKSLIWKHIVFEFEECIKHKSPKEIDHIYPIIIKIDNFIDKILRLKENSEHTKILEILNNLKKKLNDILNQTKFIPNQIDKIHTILNRIEVPKDHDEYKNNIINYIIKNEIRNDVEKIIAFFEDIKEKIEKGDTFKDEEQKKIKQEIMNNINFTWKLNNYIALNVVPYRSTLGGTINELDDELFKEIENALKEIRSSGIYEDKEYVDIIENTAKKVKNNIKTIKENCSGTSTKIESLVQNIMDIINGKSTEKLDYLDKKTYEYIIYINNKTIDVNLKIVLAINKWLENNITYYYEGDEDNNFEHYREQIENKAIKIKLENSKELLIDKSSNYKEVLGEDIIPIPFKSKFNEENTYEFGEYSLLKKGMDKNNPFDVFNNRIGLCKGYASLFNFMLNKCNITNHIVSYSPGASRGLGHTFNVIKHKDHWIIVEPQIVKNRLEELLCKKNISERDINLYHKNLIDKDNAYCLNEVKIFNGSRIETEVFNFPEQSRKTVVTFSLF